MSTGKDLAREFCPPVLWRALRRLKLASIGESAGHVGDYASFDHALADSDGYDSTAVVDAMLAHRAGLAPSATLSQLEIRLLAALLVAQDRLGSLRILDFGGGLGVHFLRLGSFLRVERWTVLELPRMAAAGAALGNPSPLRFATEIGDERPNLILASGALQYAPDPYERIAALRATGAEFFLIDRLPLLAKPRLTVQRVPREIYRGSFPAWFLGREQFLAAFAGWEVMLHWTLPEERPTLDGRPGEPFEGVLFSSVTPRPVHASTSAG